MSGSDASPSTPPATCPPDVRVSYTYGFSADIGGGPYTREIVSGPSLWTKTVRQTGNADFDSVAAAVLKWESEGHPSGTITVLDSATYDEAIELSVADRGTLYDPGTRRGAATPGPARRARRELRRARRRGDSRRGADTRRPAGGGPGARGPPLPARTADLAFHAGARRGGERRRGQGQRLAAGGGRLEHRRERCACRRRRGD